MRTDPIEIEGVAGPVVVKTRGLGGVAIEVNGRDVPKSGPDRFELPARRGAVIHAELRMKFWQVYPKLWVHQQEVPTGPAMPIWLTILACLPLLLFVFSNWVGFVVGALALLTNQAQLREGRTHLGRAVRVIIANLLAWALWTMVNVMWAIPA